MMGGEPITSNVLIVEIFRRHHLFADAVGNGASLIDLHSHPKFPLVDDLRYRLGVF